MKISIITVTLNNKPGLIRAIESVRSQTYKNVEHIIVDGSSTDGTVEMLKEEFQKFGGYEDRKILSPSLSTLNDNVQDNSEMKTDNQPITNNQTPIANYSLHFISEKDNGIYDAINKGIKLATGDVIGLLHSDDFFADEFVLERYAEVFEGNGGNKAYSKSQLTTTPYTLPTIDAVYSDLVYVGNKKPKAKRRDYNSNSIEHFATETEYFVIRRWKTHKNQLFKKVQNHEEILKGWMPPHPTLFLRKEVFEKYGLYRTDMKIAADYEMILRLFYKYKISSYYLPVTTYCMSIGGKSNKSLKNILQKSSEDYRAMKMHGLPFPSKTLLLKNLIKFPQFFRKNH